MLITKIQLALPPASKRPPFANNEAINTLREKVLTKLEHATTREVIFDNFVALNPTKQKGFLERLFKNDPKSPKFSTLKEEGAFQVANSLFNKSQGISSNYRKKLDEENAQKLKKALKLT